ncbi:MAG: adenosylcobinamide-GDP ribazoletransferase [Lachnospiraceae bacterium]|nr:adenosylcobinamide-GDP ribazoletransferase [Lachnospiraceae bacterium]
MRIIETVAAAFSMFSAIPVPSIGSGQDRGEKEKMRYFLLAFPLVGVFIGLTSCAALYICLNLNMPDILRGMILTIIPVLITGGIHLDGYADTCDALASLGDVEKKHRILKDPHIGTFAVIRLCVYFIISFSVWCVMREYSFIKITLMYTVSRVLSGLSVVSFPVYKDTGLVHVFSETAEKKIVRRILIVFDILMVTGFVLQGFSGIVMAAVSHVIFILYYRICVARFGGVSGDLCGWFLCKCEVWMLIALEACAFINSVY